jgi:hypothetical protein
MYCGGGTAAVLKKWPYSGQIKTERIEKKENYTKYK